MCPEGVPTQPRDERSVNVRGRGEKVTAEQKKWWLRGVLYLRRGQSEGWLDAEDKKRLSMMERRLRRAIGRLDHPEYQDVLQGMYLDGLTWAELSERMHYAYEARGVYKLHERAVLALKL